MIFTFSHIPYFIQLVAGLSLTVYYLVIIFIEFDLVYECSLVTNKTIRAEASHVWNLLTTLVIYQLMARHIIYVSKIEAMWDVPIYFESSLDGKFDCFIVIIDPNGAWRRENIMLEWQMNRLRFYCTIFCHLTWVSITLSNRYIFLY